MGRRLAILLFAGVVVACSSGSSPSEPAPPAQITLAEVIEGLFLGSGRVGLGGCVTNDEWSTYEDGADVTFVVAATVQSSARVPIERELDELGRAIGGRFSLSMELSNEPDPDPGPYEVVSVDLSPADVEAFCGPSSTGCYRVTFANLPFLNAGRAVQRRNHLDGAVHVHELGHAIGLCHLDGRQLGNAVMGSPQSTADRFTVLELQAIRAVFSSELEPGALRADFVAAGLID